MKNHTDVLTGLPNRESLGMKLKELIASEETVSLALIDIDNFMEINDKYGHDAGDHVINTVVACIAEMVPPGALFRVSGDEFGVVLSGTTLEQAFLHMESIRIKLNQSQQRFHEDGRLPSSREIAITAGVAQFPRDAKDDVSLMRTANAALGTAKESGKNQIALPPNEEMIMKSCYYPSTMVRKLKALADKLSKKESYLLREALTDLLRKYDRIEES